eukprot:401154_1
MTQSNLKYIVQNIILMIIIVSVILYYCNTSNIWNTTSRSLINHREHNTHSSKSMNNNVPTQIKRYTKHLNAKQRIKIGQQSKQSADVSNIKWNAKILKIFLHFHKAGGTSIVKAAQKRANFFSPNANGNPYKRSGKFHLGAKPLIKFWTYNETDLENFLSLCLNHKHISFIAMENNYFWNRDIINDQFKKRNKIEIVTQIRDPFDRFLSNYYFDIKYKFYTTPINLFYKKKTSLIDRLKAYHKFNNFEGNVKGKQLWNMYVRVLTNNFDPIRNVTADDLQIAKHELDKFDMVSVLDKYETLELWTIKYGLSITHKNANQGSNKMNHEGLDEFETEFKILNQYDYQLYEYALELAVNMLNANASKSLRLSYKLLISTETNRINDQGIQTE